MPPQSDGHGVSSQSPATQAQTIGIPGAIERIRMWNFMCHENVRVELGKNLTFIVGQNGSGKSAVLAAIHVALTGRARGSERAGSLTELVRGGGEEGASEGWIQVTIFNVGEDAYKPYLFGSRIVIERKLVKAGGGRNILRLLNAQGSPVSPGGKRVPGQGGNDDPEQTVASPAKELAQILEHFNIDVDNPMTIMSQQQSKEFLHSGSGEKQYKFFMRATMLQKVKENLEAASSKADKINSRIETAKENLEKEEQNLQTQRKYLENIQKAEQYKYEKQKLEFQLAWAYVDKTDHEISIARARLSEGTPPEDAPERVKEEWGAIRKRVDKEQRKCDEQKEVVDTKQREVDEAKKKLEEEIARTRAVNEEKNTALQNLQDVDNKIKNQNTQWRRADNKLKKQKHTMERQQERINEAYERQKDASNRQNEMYEEAKKMENELRSIQDEIQELKGKSDTHAKEEEDLVSKYYDLQYKLRGKEKEIQEKDEDIKKKDNQLRQVQRSSAAATFGDEETNKVLNAIRNGAGKFKRTPIGPVGSCISLQDSNWNLAVELAIGPALDTVLLDNFEDKKEYDRLAKQVVGKALPCDVAPFDRPRFNVASSGHVTTMLDVLKSNRDVVINFLITRNKIERIALTSDRKSLEQVVFSGHYNVNEGYNSNGDNAKVLNGTNMYNPVGSTVKRIPQGRVGVETRHMVQGMEGQLKELRTEREKISEGHRQVKSEMDEVSKQLSVSKGESRKIEDKKKDLERKAHQKRNEIEAKHEKAQNTSETNEEANLAQLRSEYFEAEQEAEHAEQEKKEAEEQLTQLREEKEAKEKEHKDIANRLQNESDDPIREEYRQAQNALEEAQQAMEKYSATLQKRQQQKEEMENLLQQKEKEREENARIARQVCTEEELEKVGRAEPEKDGEDVTDALNRNLKRMKKRIEKIEGHAMSEEEEQRIEREVEQKEQYCNKRRRLIGDAEKPYEKIQSMIDYRTEILRKNCNVKGEKLDNHFKATLYQRQYTGNLKLDINNELVKMNVQVPGDANPTASEQQSKKKRKRDMTDPRQLSGGERSYSTLAFFLAVGKEAETPFCCADEFDVFMDEGNRQRALLELVKFARHKQETQFILLTPNDISAVKDQVDEWNGSQGRDLVKIVHMRNSDRGSTQES